MSTAKEVPFVSFLFRLPLAVALEISLNSGALYRFPLLRFRVYEPHSQRRAPRTFPLPFFDALISWTA